MPTTKATQVQIRVDVNYKGQLATRSPAPRVSASVHDIKSFTKQVTVQSQWACFLTASLPSKL
jgi:hypothetical protein